MTNETTEQNDIFLTSDLTLAVTISLFRPIEAITWETPSKARFSFGRDDELEGLIEAFWRWELKVEPQAYFNQLKSIKARLRNERQLC